MAKQTAVKTLITVQSEWDTMTLGERDDVLYDIGGDILSAAYVMKDFSELPRTIARQITNDFMAAGR